MHGARVASKVGGKALAKLVVTTNKGQVGPGPIKAFIESKFKPMDQRTLTEDINVRVAFLFLSPEKATQMPLPRSQQLDLDTILEEFCRRATERRSFALFLAEFR